ncbi:MAG TPA: glycosyltransferase [Labilithrix sp.]|nr:glycosyltransferase [Labilithrix sp.]
MAMPSVSAPPRVLGSSAIVVAELARELRHLGHRPTVFTTIDRRFASARTATPEAPNGEPDRLAELRHASASWAEIAARGAFDVVHVHHPEALPFSRFVPVPTVATVHHERHFSLSAHYAAHPDVAFVAVSQRQVELSWEVPFRAVIHPGLDIERHPLGRGGERCAFVGTFTPDMGPHIAMEAARRARVPLLLGGDPHASYLEYFEREIARRTKNGIAWAKSVDRRQRLELLAKSRCLLYPIQHEDPFGLVMIEAMLVGTPVIAFACGAAPEVVEDGVTGFIVHHAEEMAHRIRDVESIDRKACRARARARWGSARMAREYASVYVEAMDRYAAKERTASCRRSDAFTPTSAAADEYSSVTLVPPEVDVLVCTMRGVPSATRPTR